jgi:ribosomal protein L40E
MKGPFRRIRSPRRPSDPAGQETQATVVAPPVPADATAEHVPPAATAEPVPAGLTADDVAPGRPSFRDRGRLRRRMRYLRSVRELGFRDLGGMVFDLHRFTRRNDELVLAKLAALDAVDRELRAIERVLDERRDIIELREPGVAACPRCGALHGSDARFCPQCGTQLSGPLALGAAVGGPAPKEPVVAPGPISTPVSGALAQQPTQAGPTEPDRDPQPARDGNGTAAPPTDVERGRGPVTSGEPLARGDRPES